MQFSKLAAFAALLAYAQAKIGFTQAPAGSVTAGQAVELKWTGGTGAPVTITLKQGNPDSLSTVAIITGDASGTSFSWTPSTSLPNAQNYALEISEGTGVDETNFSGEFALQGGSTAAPTASGASATSVVTVTSANSTATVAHTVFATGTGPAASGTGISMARNTTFVHATSKTATMQHTGLSAGSATATQAASSASGAASPSSSGLAGQVGAQVGAVGMAFMAAVAFL